MKRFLTLPLLALLVLLAACSPTRYVLNDDPTGSGHGYSQSQIDENTYQVAFKGNGHTPPESVSRYALYRCAELTQEKGYDYFIVTDDKSAAMTTGSSGKYGGDTETENSVIKTIKLYKGQKPDDNPSAYNAKSMVSIMTPSIER